MSDNIVTASEIHLTDVEGNVVAILKAHSHMINRTTDAASILILDKEHRVRAQLTMCDQDPGGPFPGTDMFFRDDEGDVVWHSSRDYPISAGGTFKIQ